MIPSTWHDLVSAREEWEDAPSNDTRLEMLLEVAKDKVVAYAGAADRENITTWGFSGVVPRLREAQLRVAINLWNDEEADTTAIDPDFPTSRRYLEWKKLVRPQRGVPRVR